MIISIIAAMTYDKKVIGNNNVIPWNSKEDMKYFKEKTLNHPVIMGRKTWDSLRVKPLKNRYNVVITTNKNLHNYEDAPEEFGPTYVDSLATAIDYVDGMANQAFIIGGSQIYNEAINLDLVDRMYLNYMKTEVEGDCYFPYIDHKLWKQEKVNEVYNDFDAYVFVRNNDE